MTSHAVKVTRDETESIKLDTEALYSVLCRDEIADNPVVVIGIAGCLRTGKSFLLSFLMRYLRGNGWENPEWIGDDDTAANEGIEWRRGRKAHTKGIVIWNEIFTVQNRHGERMSVLLVDSQGLFDETMTKENNTKLFTLTMLMCSTLMLNVMSRINERDLESLQFFVSYAQSAQKRDEETPFMDLLFLIRDWPDDDDDIKFGLEEGKKFVEELLGPKPNSELNEMRRHLKSSFRTLQCFLMPHPGLNVQKAGFEGRNGDIDRAFLEYVQELASHTLNPEVMHKQFLDGKARTGSALYTLLSECNNAFQSGEMPSVTSMTKAMADARNKTAYEKGLKHYERSMDKVMEATAGSTSTLEDLRLFHRDSQEKALEIFRKETKFGSEDDRVVFRKRLIEDCQERLEQLCELSDAERIKARNTSLDIVHARRLEYKEAMKKKINGRAKGESELNAMHERMRENCIKSYQSEAAMSAAYYEEDERMLDGDLSRLFARICVVNDERERLEILGNQEDCNAEYEAFMLVHHLSQQYRDEFEKYSAVYIKSDELEKQMNELHEAYIQLFENHWNHSWPPIDQYRAMFLGTLEKECQDAVGMNERNKKLFESKIQQYQANMKSEYKEIMYQVTKETYVEPEKLKEMHDETQSKLIENQASVLVGFPAEMMQALLGEATEAFADLFAEIRKINESNKPVKQLLDPMVIKSLFEKAMRCATVIVPIIGAVVARVKTAKSVYGTIAPLVSSLELLPAAEAAVATAPVASGAVAALAIVGAVGVVVVAYYVYTHYSDKNTKVAISSD